MATWRSNRSGKEASMGWLQGAFTPEPAVLGAKHRHTARESDFMLQWTAAPRGTLMTTVIVPKTGHITCPIHKFHC